MNVIVMAAMMLAMVFVMHRGGHRNHATATPPAPRTEEVSRCEEHSGGCSPSERPPDGDIEPPHHVEPSFQPSK